MAAMDEVFATLELFEAIFLSIPHRDLLVSAPLVCRTWYHTVLSSSPIQQRLFLAPAPSNTSWIQNPILATKFWPFFHDVRCHNDFAEELRGEFWGSSHYNLSPCMRYLMAGPHGLGTMECFGQAGQEVYFRPEASWRKMLVVQPPVDVLRIYQHGLSEDYAEYAGVEWLDPRKEIHLLHGLTMWDVFAEVVQKLDGRRSGGMGIQWNMWDIVESNKKMRTIGEQVSM